MTEIVLTVLVVVQLVASYRLRRQVQQLAAALQDFVVLAQSQHAEVCETMKPLAERERLAKVGRELLRERLAARGR